MLSSASLVLLTEMWGQMRCGRDLAVNQEAVWAGGAKLEEPGPCTWSSAHDSFWEQSEAPSLPRASVSLPVREVLTHIPGRRDVQTVLWKLCDP